MTLEDFVRLATAYRAIDTETVTAMNLVLVSRATDATTAGLMAIYNWLRGDEQLAGDDDELADQVGGALLYVSAALDRKERR